MKRIKITGRPTEGADVVSPTEVHITDMDTGEVIHNIQKLEFSASVDQLAVKVTLELLPTEIELENFIAEVIPAKDMQKPPMAKADGFNGVGAQAVLVPVYELGNMDPVRWVNIERKTDLEAVLLQENGKSLGNFAMKKVATTQQRREESVAIMKMVDPDAKILDVIMVGNKLVNILTEAKDVDKSSE